MCQFDSSLVFGGKKKNLEKVSDPTNLTRKMDNQLEEWALATMSVAVDAISQLLQETIEEDTQYEEEMVIAALPSRGPNIDRSQVFLENIIPSLSAEEFRQHFRLMPQTFEFVLSEVGADLQPIVRRNTACSAEKQLLMALWRFGTPDSYRSIVLRFGVAKATGIKAVDQVSSALTKIAPKHITWPIGERAMEVCQGFARAHGFPDVVGAMDGTHIVIPAPSENAEAYVNRKSKHSIQCQLVCDHQRLITHVYVGHVGSVHDARVFRLSPVYDFVQDPTKFSGGTHIIGDSAYPLGECLLVPYTNNGHLTRSQRNYNFCHSSTRMVIERTNGLLKGRWRSLLHCLAMTRVEMIPYHVMACCVLHNICLIRNDEIAYSNENDADGDEDEPEHNVLNRNGTDRRAGEVKRTRITQLLPMRLHDDDI